MFKFSKFLLNFDLSDPVATIGTSSKNSDPRWLILVEKLIGPIQLQTILNCLKESKSLGICRLDLSLNNLGSEGLKVLGDWIKECSNVNREEKALSESDSDDNDENKQGLRIVSLGGAKKQKP